MKVAFAPGASAWLYDASPDGRFLLLQTQSSEDYAGVFGMSLYDAETDQLRKLLSPRGGVESASVSPDGSHVAFAEGGFDPGHKQSKVVLLDRSDGTNRVIGKGWNPAWLPASAVARADGR